MCDILVPYSQDDASSPYANQGDAGKAGVEFNEEVDEGGEEKEILEWEEEESKSKSLVDLFKKGNKFLHLLPKSSEVDTTTMAPVGVSFYCWRRLFLGKSGQKTWWQVIKTLLLGKILEYCKS